ncbi:hypothetical protein BHM03_00036560 [Ensete ventricosum]|nr:hypothetical protein BHM03_00036560 [Ensete ventricosum]
MFGYCSCSGVRYCMLNIPFLMSSFKLINRVFLDFCLQGNLIGRAVIEFCHNGPPVKNFISLGGPHAGTASVPLCGVSVLESIFSCLFWHM